MALLRRAAASAGTVAASSLSRASAPRAAQVAASAASAASTAGMAKRAIHFESAAVAQNLQSGRRQSSALNKVAQGIEHKEHLLRKKVDGLSPHHDIHRIPGYKEAFLASQEVKVVERGIQSSYNRATRTVTLADSRNHNHTAHELQHASDHLHRAINFADELENLAAEKSAFSTQLEVETELGSALKTPRGGLTASQEAQKYEGKPNYPGTLASSEKVVAARTKN